MTEQIQTFPSGQDRSLAVADGRAGIIEVDGLSKRYGGRTAVDDLTFSVRPGTITGFLGPNGAGKSTTMRLILGLDRPSAGTSEGAPPADPCVSTPTERSL